MTDTDALRRAMAELMGWEVLIPESSPDLICYGLRMEGGLAEFIIPQADWHPDTDIAQCFQYIVPRMRELGWYLTLNQWEDGIWNAVLKKVFNETDDAVVFGHNTNPATAVSLAAKAVWEQGEAP